MKQIVADLRAGTGFRPSLRVKGVQGHPRIFEMTWAGKGRATFEYGPEQKPGEPHIIWRRIGGHDTSRTRSARARQPGPNDERIARPGGHARHPRDDLRPYHRCGAMISWPA